MQARNKKPEAVDSKKSKKQNRRVNQNLVIESLDRLSYVDEFFSLGMLSVASIIPRLKPEATIGRIFDADDPGSVTASNGVRFSVMVKSTNDIRFLRFAVSDIRSE